VIANKRDVRDWNLEERISLRRTRERIETGNGNAKKKGRYEES
jgi:hypothetical protein